MIFPILSASCFNLLNVSLVDLFIDSIFESKKFDSPYRFIYLISRPLKNFESLTFKESLNVAYLNVASSSINLLVVPKVQFSKPAKSLKTLF